MSGTPNCKDHGLRGNAQGYARSWDSGTGRKMLAHRKVFRDAHGYLPEAVMHSCDNTRCIEVAHLIPGTRDLNNKDRAAKGRSAKFRLDLRRLTLDQVAEIRERFAQRNPRYDLVNGPVALARQFGVDPNVIYQVASGRTYR